MSLPFSLARWVCKGSEEGISALLKSLNSLSSRSASGSSQGMFSNRSGLPLSSQLEYLAGTTCHPRSVHQTCRNILSFHSYSSSSRPLLLRDLRSKPSWKRRTLVPKAHTSGLHNSPAVRPRSSGHSRQHVRSAASGTLTQPAELRTLCAPGQHISRTPFPQQHPIYDRSPSNLHVPQQGPGPSNRPAWQTSYNSQETPQRPQLSSNVREQIRAATPELSVIEGVVKTITMENRSTGYVVAKIKVNMGEVSADKMQKKGIVTAVAVHKQMLLGQKVRLEGTWEKHKKYGQQLKVENVVAHQLSERDGMMAMLHAAALPGVGPVTASRLADHYGAELSSVMDAPNAAWQLSQVKGIGAVTARRIKEAWDSSKGKREAASFLQGLGLQGKVVQRIVARHSNSTKDTVCKDPYHALRNIKGMSLRMAESVAKQLEADDQLPSRAAMAMQDTLLEAARQRGHTFLTWDQLQQQALQYLNTSGLIWKGNDLSKIAQQSAAFGDIVVELGNIVTPESDAPGNSEDCHPAHVEASLKTYLSSRVPGVGTATATKLVNHFGSGVLDVLQGPDAVAQMSAVPKLAAFAARDIKDKWDTNPRRKGAWVSPDPGMEVLPVSQRPKRSVKQAPFSIPVTPELWSGSVRCYHPEMHVAEVTVARELARLAARPALPIKSNNRIVRNDPEGMIDKWIIKNERGTGMKLSDGQRAAVKAASSAPILVLTGGPGCGKTYTTATIVKLWCAMKKKVRLAAPTGRASQRLQEMAGLSSSTIHRLLQYKPASGRARDGDTSDEEEGLEGSYNFCRSNPLDAEAVLVDEAAMLDVNLAAALLESLPPHCQLILVGDVDQLPPVGPGTVLSAAIQSGAIPVIDLREIFRQAQQSAIVTAAHAIQQGQFPDLMPLQLEDLEEEFRGGLSSDALWVKPEGTTDGKSLQSLVVKVLRKYIHPMQFNAATDVQVLAPMRRGTAGVESMNQQLQALINPGREEVPELPRHAGSRLGGPVFRLNDRVIQTINNYDREVFNGDPGFIVEVNPDKRTLKVEFPQTDFEKIQAGQLKKVVEYNAASLWELDLAWATTVHKAQGGESPVVVLMLSHSHKPLLTRRLLYTALTRAKKLVVVVGPEKAIRTAIAEVKGDMRLSSLQPRLQAQASRLRVPPKELQRFGAQPALNPVEVACTASSSGPAEQVVADIASGTLASLDQDGQAASTAQARALSASARAEADKPIQDSLTAGNSKGSRAKITVSRQSRAETQQQILLSLSSPRARKQPGAASTQADGARAPTGVIARPPASPGDNSPPTRPPITSKRQTSRAAHPDAQDPAARKWAQDGSVIGTESSEQYSLDDWDAEDLSKPAAAAAKPLWEDPAVALYTGAAPQEQDSAPNDLNELQQAALEELKPRNASTSRSSQRLRAGGLLHKTAARSVSPGRQQQSRSSTPSRKKGVPRRGTELALLEALNPARSQPHA